MRIRDRQVDDDVDLWIGEKLIDGLGLDAIFGGPGLRRSRIDVGAGDNLQAAKQRRQREVGGGDIAASDDADAEFLGHLDVFLFKSS